MNQQIINEIFYRFHERQSQPKTELVYHSTFELLIAVMLSAQATDVSVNKATKVLFQVANTPENILQLGLTSLTPIIQSINFYRNKAKNILKTCEILVNDYHGEVPDTREALEALPGVGRKTANVVLNSAFGQATIAVDTHIFRVANRTKLAPGKTPKEVELKLLEIIPETYLKNAHHWLVLHGRYTCKAKNPNCANCLIQNLCEYEAKVI